MIVQSRRLNQRVSFNKSYDLYLAQPTQNLSLVKLGNELHGPEDAMYINMDHVLFTEELKEDSRVVDAVKRYLEENP